MRPNLRVLLTGAYSQEMALDFLVASHIKGVYPQAVSTGRADAVASGYLIVRSMSCHLRHNS
jgi:hypothetical protein